MLHLSGEEGWLKPSLLAILFWGLWGFLTKVAGAKVHWQTMMIFLSIATISIALFGKLQRPTLDVYHVAGFASGIACALGYLFFYQAITKGQASVVVPFTSLYVAVSVILAFIILLEPITLKKLLGIACAVIAMILLTGQD
jgi:transporter family protein